MSLNANAKEFVFNPTAREWAPGGFSSAPKPPQPPAQEAPAEKAPEPVPAPQPTSSSAEESDDIDENDPLWKATLKLTLGDREKAMKMLEDPDSLMQYPEIKKLMEEGDVSGGADDWEQVEAENIAESSSSAPEPARVEEAVSPKKVADSVPETPTEPDLDEDGNPIAAVSEVLTDGDPREHLNIVFIGHVDAGKSTLSGSILYLSGMVDQRTIERFEREAKQRNRESWFLAFIMDTSEEERAKGKTVEVGRAHFSTDVNRYTILDAPGHKNYVPNMIAGAAQADVGILVISARKGEFETGFEKGGQTREHALLARTLGVQHLIVVINKMDDPTVEWDRDRFEECVTKLKPYLRQVGYTIKTDVKFIPISALSGDNVRDEVPSSKCAWWKDVYMNNGHNTSTPTLISTLNALKIENRNPEGALRVPCLDRYFERGTVVLGKVESGTLRVGDEIVIMPTKKKTKVEEIVIGESKVRSAKPGENVMVKLNVNVEDIQKGYVICQAVQFCPAVVEIKVQLALVDMLEHRPVFTAGYEAVMHVHTVEIEVTCKKIISVTDKGQTSDKPFARNGQVCVARLVMPLHTCMESFERQPALGRVTLRDEGRTIAIGKILDLYRDKPTVAK